MNKVITDKDISLFGWDTVYGISYSEINKAIKDLRVTPTEFKSKYENQLFGNTTSIEGKWGDWQLTTESDGENVAFKCPIISGEVTTNNKTFSFNNEGNPNWINIELKLEYVKSIISDYTDSTAKKGSGKQQNLLVNAKYKNEIGSVVSILNQQFSFKDKSNGQIMSNYYNKEIKDKCISLFGDWFNNKISEFKFIFSKFIINQIADKKNFQWLKPTSISYALASASKDLDSNLNIDHAEEEKRLLEKSIFGVMAMTENRTNKNMSHEIDRRLLNFGDGHSVFAINSTLFLKKWILPGLISIVPGSKKEDYEITDNNLSYTNKNKINWRNFKDEKGNNVAAVIDSNGLKLGIENDEIRFDISGLHWEVLSGVTVHVNYTEYYEVNLKSGIDKQGKPYKNVLTVHQVGFEDNSDKSKRPKLYMSFSTLDAKKYPHIFNDVATSILESFNPSSSKEISKKIGLALKNSVIESNNSGSDKVTIDLFKASGISDDDVLDR